MTTSSRNVFAFVLAMIVTATAAANAPATSDFNLPSQALADSLRAVAGQTNSNIFFDRALVAGISARALRARVSVAAALNQLLDGTGLTYRYSDDKTVAIVRIAASRVIGDAAESATAAVTSSPLLLSQSDSTRSSEIERTHDGSAEIAQATMTDRNTGKGGTLDEIVVTAQRKQQRLQDVPIAVTAVMSEGLLAANATDLRTTFLAVPALQARTNIAGYTTYTIRGLGGGAGGGGNIGEEASVAIYVDGFYYTNSFSAIFGLANFDHVEVLKGPQGTLFGRNSSAGVIQFITSEPSHDPTYNANIAYENYNRLVASQYASGPVTSNISYSIAVNVDNQGTGWGHNYTTGRDANTTSNEGARVKFMFEPSENLKSIFAADASHFFSTNTITGAGLQGGVIGGNLRTAPGVGLYDSQADILGPGLEIHQWGVQNTTTYNTGSVVVKNLAQYRLARADLTVDPDYGPQPLINYLEAREDQTATEEFQVASEPSARTQWVAGVFYMYYNSFYPPPVGVWASGLALGPYSDISYRRQEVNSAAAFAQASFNIVKNTTLTTGFRYSVEWRRADYFDYLTTTPEYNIPPINYLPSFYNEHKPSWRIALDHKFTDDIMGYISYNRGFKSGSLDPNNPPGPDHPPVASEQVDDYEVGMKSEFFDHRLRVNIDGFYYNFSNYQTSSLVQAPNGVLVLTPGNAAGANFHGAEIELQAKPTPELDLSLLAAYVSAEFKTYTNVPVYYKNANDIGTLVPINASGLPVPNVRKFTFTAGAHYDFAVANGNLGAGIQLYHTSGAYSFQQVGNGGYPADPELTPRGYNLINIDLSYAPGASRWSARIYVNNVGDKQVSTVTLSSLAEVQSPLVGPRTFGAGFSYKY